jgi:hypothetical protein
MWLLCKHLGWLSVLGKSLSLRLFSLISMLSACHCSVAQDGWGGPTCETRYEETCVNQCNGHGECLSGFCKCHDGWFGTDCANRQAGVPWTPGVEEGDRPWLKRYVHTPAARDPKPGETCKRPLIYVYDLPAIYNSVFLQYREDKHLCTHRLISEDNSSTIFTDGWVYGIETGLHEMLLQSEHRTLDPEAADYFYIPAYSSCVIYPIMWATDFPYFHGGPAVARVPASVNMLMEVHHYISTRLPYWNRNGGRDHIVVSFVAAYSCCLSEAVPLCSRALTASLDSFVSLARTGSHGPAPCPTLSCC